MTAPFQPANVLDHQQSPRTSVTVLDVDVQPSPSLPLDQEIANDEARMERYGGDNIREPPKLSTKEKEPSPASQQESFLVTWDAPDDQENPQNWTNSRKWSLTFLLSALTINV